MPRYKMSEWVSLSSIQRLNAIGKTARTRDGKQGTILRFVGQYMVLRADSGREVTAPVGECQVRASRMRDKK